VQQAQQFGKTAAEVLKFKVSPFFVATAFYISFFHKFRK